MLSVCIQAGGASTRMGNDKALLPFNGEPLIQRVMARLASIADEIFIVSNHPERFKAFDLPVYPDELPGIGALGGLYTALTRANGDLLAMAACDMPFAEPKLLEHMANEMVDTAIDAMVPKTNGYYEPAFAVYRRSVCLPLVRQSIDLGEKRLISWFERARIETLPDATLAELDPLRRAFVNVNTPEEFAAAERLALISE